MTLDCGGGSVCVESEGFHNSKLEASRNRLITGATYRDLSTICVMPIKGQEINHIVAQAVEGLIKPMNQPFARWIVANCEVGDAYNTAIQQVLDHPQLSKWKFLLTVEHDNVPAPDALTRLQGAMYSTPYAAISGLYWTKGLEGQPMIYGDPKVFPPNYIPQLPEPDTIQECRGIGMGFALWDLNLFKDPRLKNPWFETKQSYDPFRGTECGTQDLTFCRKATDLGYRFAVASDVRVGHMDINTASPEYGLIW